MYWSERTLLWGVVGALSFLVSVQGYELLAGDPVGWGVKFGVAALVGLAATAATGLLDSRLPDGDSPRDEDRDESRSGDESESP